MQQQKLVQGKDLKELTVSLATCLELTKNKKLEWILPDILYDDLTHRILPGKASGESVVDLLAEYRDLRHPVFAEMHITEEADRFRWYNWFRDSILVSARVHENAPDEYGNLYKKGDPKKRILLYKAPKTSNPAEKVDYALARRSTFVSYYVYCLVAHMPAVYKMKDAKNALEPNLFGGKAAMKFLVNCFIKQEPEGLYLPSHHSLRAFLAPVETAAELNAEALLAAKAKAAPTTPSAPGAANFFQSPATTNRAAALDTKEEAVLVKTTDALSLVSSAAADIKTSTSPSAADIIIHKFETSFFSPTMKAALELAQGMNENAKEERAGRKSAMEIDLKNASNYGKILHNMDKIAEKGFLEYEKWATMKRYVCVCLAFSLPFLPVFITYPYYYSTIISTLMKVGSPKKERAEAVKVVAQSILDDVDDDL